MYLIPETFVSMKKTYPAYVIDCKHCSQEEHAQLEKVPERRGEMHENWKVIGKNAFTTESKDGQGWEYKKKFLKRTKWMLGHGVHKYVEQWGCPNIQSDQ